MVRAVVAAGLAALVGVPTAAGRGTQAHAADAQQCADPYPATRDASNPLDLPTAPGADPLTGANFFVDGPRHGEAAGAPAKLLGLNPNRYPDSYSWARFEASLGSGKLHRKLARNQRLARKVALLSKLAAEPRSPCFRQDSSAHGPRA